MNKKILIDCGSNYGQGFRELSRILSIDNDWKIIMFEPNKECYDFLCNKYKKDNIDINNCAVWNADTTMTLVIPDSRLNNYSQGSTFLGDIFSNHLSHGYEYDNQYEIDTIDLANVLNEYKDYQIYLKLDIEGAEYDVLEHLIKLDLIKYIQKIFVEFHNRFVKNELREEYDTRYKSIIQYFNDHNVTWSKW